MIKIFFKDIFFIESMEDYVVVHRRDTKIITKDQIGRLEELLPRDVFIRIHRLILYDTARLLESLYDAVDCEELPAGFAQRLQAQLGVPVYDGLARDDHPILGLLSAVAGVGSVPGDADRRALMQAVLVSTLL